MTEPSHDPFTDDVSPSGRVLINMAPSSDLDVTTEAYRMTGSILTFGEGFHLSMGELHAFDDVEFASTPPPNSHFHLYSQSQGASRFIGNDNPGVAFEGEQVGLFRPREWPGGLSRIKAGENIKCFELHISLPRVVTWLDGRIPDNLKPLMSDVPRHGLALPLPILGVQHNLAQLARRMPYSGVLKEMALEGAALQMIAGYFSFIAESSPRDWPGINGREYRGIYTARELLLTDLRRPPSIAVLAQTVGMSPRRLNAGFRETFGLSIFQLLIQARLEFARSALIAGGMSVKEVAYATGYSHVSNFSAAFRARFGVPPSHVAGTRSHRSF
jgi:AraC-like DNA-binding protein